MKRSYNNLGYRWCGGVAVLALVVCIAGCGAADDEPALTYGIVESSHSILLHAWLDQFMGVREWEATSRQAIPPR